MSIQNRYSRAVKLAMSHPRWFLAELGARCRTRLGPQHGVRRSRVGGLHFEFDLDADPIVRQMYAQSYEIDVVSVLRAVLRPGDVFVDVGANIGYLSCLAAGLVGPSGRILSFEPEQDNFARLQRVCELNPGYQWEILQAAVGSEEGTAQLQCSRNNIGWRTIVPDGIPEENVREVVEVPLRTLDASVPAAGINHVRLVKVDTEGYEGPVLVGARKLLEERRIDHLIVEINRSQWEKVGVDFEALIGNLSDMGYQAHEVRHPFRPVQFEELYWAPDVWFRRID